MLNFSSHHDSYCHVNVSSSAGLWRSCCGISKLMQLCHRPATLVSFWHTTATWYIFCNMKLRKRSHIREPIIYSILHSRPIYNINFYIYVPVWKDKVRIIRTYPMYGLSNRHFSGVRWRWWSTCSSSTFTSNALASRNSIRRNHMKM